MTKTRRLGATDIETPPLILGSNVFGWTIDRDQSFKVLDAFVAGGGTMIDTADVYSAWVDGNKGGESETIIGEWLKASGKRDEVTIATKVGMLPGEGGGKLAPARIAAACDASLKRLQTDHVDLYFAHQDDEDVPQEEYLAAFGKLVEAGKVRVFGVSNFKAMRLKSARDLANANSLPCARALENEYNLISRHHYEGELQDYCVEHNIGVTPYYGLASGFLTGKYRSKDDLKKSARGGRVEKFLDDPKAKAVLDEMDQVAEETGASLAQISLAWIAAQDGITAPIASATSVEQLEELMGSIDLELSEDQLSRLTNAGAWATPNATTQLSASWPIRARPR